MEQENSETEKDLLSMLDQRVRLQRRWRRVTSFVYSVTSLGTIAASFSATVLASLGCTVHAAVSAGLATLFVSIEKTLLFRDKWKIHRMIETELQNTWLDLKYKTKDLKEIIDDIQQISMKYANELPTE